MLTKVTMRNPPEWLKLKGLTITDVGEVDPLQLSSFAGRMGMAQPLGKPFDSIPYILKRCLQKDMCRNVHGRLTCNSQNLKTVQISISRKMNKHLTTQQFLLHKLVIYTTWKNLIVNMFKKRRQISSRNIQYIGSLEQAKLTWGNVDHMVAWGDEAVALTQKGTKWDGNECSISSCGW